MTDSGQSNIPRAFAERIANNVTRHGWGTVTVEEVERVLREGWYATKDERVGKAIDAELVEYGLRGKR